MGFKVFKRGILVGSSFNCLFYCVVYILLLFVLVMTWGILGSIVLEGDVFFLEVDSFIVLIILFSGMIACKRGVF